MGNGVLAITYGSPPQLQSVWLLGAGGQIAWQMSDFDLGSAQETMLTQHGEYFYLLEMAEGYSEGCRLFHVTVE